MVLSASLRVQRLSRHYLGASGGANDVAGKYVSELAEPSSEDYAVMQRRMAVAQPSVRDILVEMSKDPPIQAGDEEVPQQHCLDVLLSLAR